MTNEKILVDIEELNIVDIFGIHDKNLVLLEKNFNVKITFRDNNIVIIGEEKNINDCKDIIVELIKIVKVEDEITEQKIKYLLEEKKDGNIVDAGEVGKDYVCVTVNGKVIRAKTLGQKKYIDNIKKNTITFGIGPAGTGKTYLAMAMAIEAFKNNEVSRIILTRPAIEAGEKLGFLPGDLQQKVDPYLRPLYDALYEIMGADNFLKNMEKGLIEVAPLAYMRGRTLDNAFVVLDEAQNTTPEQMKMFLTRIGFGSKVIVTGDATQIDLPEGKMSGLVQVTKILDGVDDIGISIFTNRDVVRHPLVQNIIKAYEKFEKKENFKETKRSRPQRGRYSKR